jgi:hypothetical protein
MSRKRKFAITGIFLVGFTSIAASAARAAIYLVTLYEGYGAGYDIDRTSPNLSRVGNSPDHLIRRCNDTALVEFA